MILRKYTKRSAAHSEACPTRIALVLHRELPNQAESAEPDLVGTSIMMPDLMFSGRRTNAEEWKTSACFPMALRLAWLARIQAELDVSRRERARCGQ
jgi:hypothetical protein